MSEASAISLAVWDTGLAVVATDTFAIEVGAKAADARTRAGRRVVVSDADGADVASGTLGDAPWPGTEALYWLALSMPAPETPQVATYQVRLAPAPGETKAAATEFTVVATGKPAHRVAVTIIERDTSKPLADVEVRPGPFRARTDAAGRAELSVCKGDHQLRLWRATHTAEPQALSIDDDTHLDLSMMPAPEAPPDQRWVR